MQPDQKDDRLDTAIGVVVAFATLIGVGLYALKPWQGGAVGSKPEAAVSLTLGSNPLRAPVSAEVGDVKPLSVLAVEVAASAEAVPLAAAAKPEQAPVAPAVVASAAPAVLAPEPVPAPVVAKAPEPAPVVVATPPQLVASGVVVQAAPAPAPVPVPVAAPAPVAEAPKVAAAEPKVVVREHINFASDSAVLPPSAQRRLKEVAQTLKDDPRTLTIAGHTDSLGPAESNTALSLARAEAVKAYLVEQGVAAEKLKAVGMGEDQPIGSNRTSRGRASNRRIDITE